MIDVTFANEKSPLEKIREILDAQGNITAMQCLEILEDVPEEEVQDILLSLEENCEKINIFDLPHYERELQTSQRLKLEGKLAKAGLVKNGLEENDPLRLYLEELDVALDEDEASLLARFNSDDEDVTQKLILLSLQRVVDRACHYAGHNMLLLDLIQEGSIGLWRGIATYEGGDYHTHIDSWIDRYMKTAALVQAHTDAVIHSVRQGMADYRDADQRLLAELGRNPTLEEIAEAIHVSPEEAATYEAMLNQARAKQQLREMTQPKEQDPEEEQAVENTAYFQTRQRISEMLSTLTQQEAKLLTLRFGLEGGMPKTPEETGAILGLTPEEVVNIEGSALLKLRQQGE